MSDWYMGKLARQDQDVVNAYAQQEEQQRRAYAFPRDAIEPPMGALAEQKLYDPNQMAALRVRNAVRPISGEGRTESEESRASYNDPYVGALELGLAAGGPSKLARKGAVALGSLLASTSEAEAGPLKRVLDPRLWSSISTQKLTKPLSEMEHLYKDVRTPVPKFVSPEDMMGGILVPTPSDLSRANRTLTHVDAQKLDRPVTAHGGVGFPEANPGMAWASEQAIARRLDNQAARLAETGKPVYIAPMTMTPQAIDASHHVADPLAQLVKQAPITNKNAAAFNKMMREEVPDWVSIKSPRFDEYINSLEGGMTTKSLMADRMAMEQWQKKGFPNVAAVRHAMSEPALIEQPRNTMGMAISRYTPGKGLLETSHPSYGKGVAGEHIGQLASLVPFETMNPTIAQGLAKHNATLEATGRKNRVNPRFHLEKPTPGVPTHQVLDQEWLDRIMMQQEAARGR